jgi:Recombination endonuclease VII
MGVDADTFWNMFKSQSGLCAICNSCLEEGTGQVHVDHNHRSGKIRDLLCRRCNIMIGLAQDNTEILSAAIRYLEKHDSL